MALNPTQSLVTDTRTLQALKSSAGQDPKAAVKEAAKQFEALFMQQLMKSMRDASMSSGMLDNEGSKLGTEMLDTQFANKMTGLPGGLAEIIAKQLERQMSGAQQAIPSTPATDTAPAGGRKGTPGQAEFVSRHGDAARAAEAQTGIPAAFMIAQAAHETGWGQREIRNADGSSSNNYFGIKAGASWKGPVAEVTTTEYVDGQARKVTAKFRAYASAAESFADYARLMKTSPRYTGVLTNATSAQDFAQGLQAAGYATDPAYADKLTRTINTTLRLQRATS